MLLRAIRALRHHSRTALPSRVPITFVVSVAQTCRAILSGRVHITLIVNAVRASKVRNIVVHSDSQSRDGPRTLFRLRLPLDHGSPPAAHLCMELQDKIKQLQDLDLLLYVPRPHFSYLGGQEHRLRLRLFGLSDKPVRQCSGLLQVSFPQ